MVAVVACTTNKATPATGRSTTSSASSTSPSSVQGVLSAKQIVEASKPAIVRIESHYPQGRHAVGTGFVVSPDGRIVTNLHVVQGAADIRVVMLGGRTTKVRRVVAFDRDRDLAVLQIDTKNALPTLRLGDSDKVSAGEHVVAIGNPLGVLDYTVSDGLISSVRAVTPLLTVLQISAPISRGSSGGPLFNDVGEVIGVATMVSREGQNLNFGVPSNYLQPLLASQQSYAMDEFAVKSVARPRAPQGPPIVRKIPKHPLSQLRTCHGEQVIGAVELIRKAITLGAPLYNQGNHEACFRVYEGAALKLQRDNRCSLVRAAMASGLKRAKPMSDFTAKAWAMRDAFDGILEVFERSRRNP